MSSSWSFEVESCIPAPRLFKAAFIDWHNLAPKIASDKVVSAVAIEGDGKPGSIRQFNFAPGMPFTVVKEKLDFIDIEKCEVKTTMIEGGPVGTFVESSSSHIVVEPKGEGSIVKLCTSYKPLPSFDAKGVETAKEAFAGHIKIAEAYLVANPDAYN